MPPKTPQVLSKQKELEAAEKRRPPAPECIQSETTYKTGTEGLILKTPDRLINDSTRPDVDKTSLGKTPVNSVRENKLEPLGPVDPEPVPIKRGEIEDCHVIVSDPEPTGNGIFSFLQLPPEIRNMVYSRVFVRPGRFIYVKGYNRAQCEAFLHDPGESLTWEKTLARFNRTRYLARPFHFKKSDKSVQKSDFDATLLQVNRQVHTEALPFLYSSHTFEFADTTSLKKFLTDIGPERTQFLTRVKVNRMACRVFVQSILLLAPAVSLRELDIFGGDIMYAAQHLCPLVRALCDAGRNREEVLRIISWDHSFAFTCPIHAHVCSRDNDNSNSVSNCVLHKQAHLQAEQDLKNDIRRRLVEAEEAEKEEKGRWLTRTKTRAGRAVKAINYCEDDYFAEALGYS